MENWIAIWKILSSIFAALPMGDKMINHIERPVFSIEPFTDVREWMKYSQITTGKPTQYYGGTVTPELLVPSKSKTSRYFTHLKIENITKHRGKNSTAKRVFAKLSFYKFSLDEDLLPSTIKPEIFGRWAESLEPPQTIDTEGLKYVDLIPGDRKTLDIATRDFISPLHSAWFAISTQSYTADQFENPSLLINESEFRVKLVLSGENVDETHWFVLYDNFNGRPKLIELRENERQLYT